MKKILLSLTTLLFLFTNSAYSVPLTIKDLNGKPKTNADGSEVQIELKETEDIRVEQIVVPENEKWMVERLLEQNPDLKEGDISRVEYSFGIYYGQISKKTPRVADGEGVLGVSIDDTDYYGIETTFKNGKLGRKSEQKILTNSGGKALEAEENLADEIKFYNQAFNNGFKIKTDLTQLLKNDVLNTLQSAFENYNNAYTGLKRNKENFEIVKRKADEVNKYLDIDYDYNEMQRILTDQDLSEEKIKRLSSYIDGARLGIERVTEEYKAYLEQRKLETEKIENNKRQLEQWIKNIEFLEENPEYNDPAKYEAYNDVVLNYRKKISSDTSINLGTILRDAMVKSQIARLENMLSNLDNAEKIMNDSENVVSLLLFQQKSLKAQNSLESLKSAQGFLDKENDFKELRIVDGFNMRKNTSGESIEAKANNGKWYEIEYVLNDDTFQLTDDSKKYYENDKRAGAGSPTDPSDGSGAGDDCGSECM